LLDFKSVEVENTNNIVTCYFMDGNFNIITVIYLHFSVVK